MKKMKLLLSIILVGIILFTTTSCDLINKYLPFLNTSTSTTHNHTSPSINKNEGVVYDDFQIHFMTLGNDKAGDSIYIKAGMSVRTAFEHMTVALDNLLCRCEFNKLVQI